MATLTPQPPGALTYAPASATGDTLALGSASRAVILVRNASAAAITLTLAGTVNCNQGFAHPVTVSCAVGDTEIVPPLNTIDAGATATRGNITMTYSAVVSVSVAAYSL